METGKLGQHIFFFFFLMFPRAPILKWLQKCYAESQYWYPLPYSNNYFQFHQYLDPERLIQGPLVHRVRNLAVHITYNKMAVLQLFRVNSYLCNLWLDVFQDPTILRGSIIMKKVPPLFWQISWQKNMFWIKTPIKHL